MGVQGGRVGVQGGRVVPWGGQQGLGFCIQSPTAGRQANLLSCRPKGTSARPQPDGPRTLNEGKEVGCTKGAIKRIVTDRKNRKGPNQRSSQGSWPRKKIESKNSQGHGYLTALLTIIFFLTS